MLAVQHKSDWQDADGRVGNRDQKRYKPGCKLTLTIIALVSLAYQNLCTQSQVAQEAQEEQCKLNDDVLSGECATDPLKRADQEDEDEALNYGKQRVVHNQDQDRVVQLLKLLTQLGRYEDGGQNLQRAYKDGD